MNQQGNSFQALRILHLALLGGITLFTIICFFIVKTKAPALNNVSLDRILQGVTAAVSLAALLIGFNLFKRKIMTARNMTEPAEKKMAQYTAACIAWWAMIEGPGLLAVISYFLTGNYAFLAMALFHITLLAVFMPRKENIIILLNLSSDEVARLEGKK